MKRIYIILTSSFIMVSCGIQTDFDIPDLNCNESISPNITHTQLKDRLGNEKLIQIHEDLIIEGYVISSDKEGNFFNSIHFQENGSDKAEGMQLEMELRDSYLIYPVGSKLFIKLKGLFFGVSNGVYKLGGAINSFGSLAIGRLPTLLIDDHVFHSCEEQEIPTPKLITIDSLNERLINTLVEITEVEFAEEELGSTYAEPLKETERYIANCNGQKIALLNSGYSNFQSELLPEGNGSVKGVLMKKGKNYKLKVRERDDITFINERCSEQRNLVTTNKILISEIADPDNLSDARFVELYNSSDDDILLDGWELRRYTNDQTEVGPKINLSGSLIEASETFVISPKAEIFESVYGFMPDLEAGTNSAADSNGDDNIELVDPFGSVIDSYGIPGEDGTGTNHEFEDGGAFRAPYVINGSPEYIFSEWEVFNDSGNSGTINQPLLAPQDFTPGIR